MAKNRSDSKKCQKGKTTYCVQANKGFVRGSRKQPAPKPSSLPKIVEEKEKEDDVEDVTEETRLNELQMGLPSDDEAKAEATDASIGSPNADVRFFEELSLPRDEWEYSKYGWHGDSVVELCNVLYI
ncbi:unnamed protein product [Cochlearia groenlandica]